MAISNIASGLRPGICTSTTRPANPYEGQTIYETDTDLVRVWSGSAWVAPNSQTVNPSGLELITGVGCSAGGTASNGVITVSSTVSSVTATDAFSSKYDNYRILVSGVDLSSNGEGIRLTLSGVSGSVYKTNLQYASWGAVSFANTGSSGASTGFILGFGGNTDNSNMVCDIFNPQLAKASGMTGSSSSETYFTVSGGLCTSTVQSTGFTITVDGGTMTGGIIRVYGYRN